MMLNNFDEGFEAAAAASTTGRDYEPVPDGTHNFTVRKAVMGPHPSPEKNPGTFLNVTLAPNGAYGFVFVNIGQNDAGKSMEAKLARALGYSERDWSSATPADLLGLELRATTKQNVWKNGKLYVNVTDMEPRSGRVQKPEHKPQTAAARVAAARGDEAGGGDDIPF